MLGIQIHKMDPISALERHSRLRETVASNRIEKNSFEEHQERKAIRP